MNPAQEELAQEARLQALARIHVVLCRPSHPGNIGATARAMKTMGLKELKLVAPRRFPHPDADALAAGASDILQRAQVHATVEEALAECAMAVGLTRRERELAQPPQEARQAAPELLALAHSQPVALVFGNETFGLSNAELAHCQRLVTLPADPAYPSLNLAAAVQVMAYELRLTALGAAALPATPARVSLREMAYFYRRLEETLIAIQFLDPAHPKRLMPRLRRLFDRCGLEKEELAILLGILKQAHRKDKGKVD
ncbi:RNA methyltransferase [Thiobacter aerophilum]|uniref:tRNA (cytidine/uridine-2'-O-)-methyltransferase TrmJ n=1 Tax=Thiobacter aerophilum TaxID=3121275 RepID=A0ABV0EGE9_9BURK